MSFSWSFTNYQELKDALDKVAKYVKIDLIISGRAKGADMLAERYATENQIPTLIFPPDWEKYGRSAGVIRNKDIIKNCDMVIAFWDGQSTGTAHSLQLAKKYKKKSLIYYFSK